MIYREETRELALRVGLNSGPVTAGVLQGERSRFQLFGDTVNTASRIESTGKKDRIHCSETTAQLLRDDGRDDWLVPRESKVHAKGKGDLTTYWIKHRVVLSSTSSSGVNGTDDSILGEEKAGSSSSSPLPHETSTSSTGDGTEDTSLHSYT